MFSQKYFISKYTIGDAGWRKTTVPDSQGASWRTCESATYQAQRRKASGYTHELQMKRWQEHYSAVLNCPEPDVLHRLCMFGRHGALQILLLIDWEDIIMPTLEVNMEAIIESDRSSTSSQ